MAERKRLTEKQKKFYRYWTEGISPKEAAELAGYRDAAKEARRLMARAERQESTTKEKAGGEDVKVEKETMAEGSAVAEKEEILGFLTEMMREDDDPRMRMKAAELLGKRANLFEKEKQQEKGAHIIIVDDVP